MMQPMSPAASGGHTDDDAAFGSDPEGHRLGAVTHRPPTP